MEPYGVCLRTYHGLLSVGFRFIQLAQLVPRSSLHVRALAVCTSTYLLMEAPRLPHTKPWERVPISRPCYH